MHHTGAHRLINFSLVKLLGWLLVSVLSCISFNSAATTLTEADLQKLYPKYKIGKLENDPPLWPIFEENGPVTDLVGYAFESIDLAPIPGFAGIPINLLVILTPDGKFHDARVLSHHEPVFVEGLGETPMRAFVSQFPGLSLKQSIKIGKKPPGSDNSSAANVLIDGVLKATSSCRIITDTILSASLKIARAKLGYTDGADLDSVARIKTDFYQKKTWQDLEKDGLIKHIAISNKTIEQGFLNTGWEGLDKAVVEEPDANFIDVSIALLNLPTVGKNLLSEKEWNFLQKHLKPGDMAFLIASKGRYSFVDEQFVRAAVPNRLTLTQGGLPITMRDMDMDFNIQTNDSTPFTDYKIFKVIGQSGLDVAIPENFALHVTRVKGYIYPERITHSYPLDFEVNKNYIDIPPKQIKGWRVSWIQRKFELLALVASLAILTAVLVLQKRVTRNEKFFKAFRFGFLVYTLFFIGYYAQGQLSIVNITSILQALKEKRALTFFLFDPMSTLLWVFTIITFFVWGRGTFCGWLCPFGAMQEFLGAIAKLIKIPQIKLSDSVDGKLKYLKYVVLFVCIAAAVLAPKVSDSINEVEPFKTSITLAFVRSYPFIIYVGVLLFAGLFIYKFYCRFLCPLGAAMALGGKLRMFKWLARRAECGKPCQACRPACQYKAIDKKGEIQYDDCFQCLDCVVIHDSPTRCVPVIIQQKNGKIIEVRGNNSEQKAA